MREATERARRIAEQLNSQICFNQSNNQLSQMSDEQRKQLNEQKELQSIYETMMSKRREIESIASQMNFKREFDLNEQNDNGTWEHQLRKAEMEATKG